MTKQQFKNRWESDDEGGGITFEDVAVCAKKWGVSFTPRTRPMDRVLYQVLKAANVKNSEEYRP
jgi:hypothetical protein